MKALLEDGVVAARLDLQAIDEYLTFRFVPAPRTLFEGVKKLPPASIAQLDGEPACASSATGPASRAPPAATPRR